MGLKIFAGHRTRQGTAALAVALAAAGGWAQYPGQTAKTDSQPVLRSVAVLEYTGEFGAPKACRLIPLLVIEGDQLFDGSTYMARPQPMAIGGEVEYEVEQNGRIAALFDIEGAAQQQGQWVGHGRWRKPPAPKATPDPMAEMSKLDVVDENADRPILHRKHPKPGTSGSGGASGGGDAKSPPPAADPDRPTLHRSAGSSSDAGSPEAAPDPDQPTIHHSSSDSQSGDSSRPNLKKGKKKEEDVAHTDALPGMTDPDRPHLKRGKVGDDSAAVTRSLEGMPAELAQAVAVSDARDRKEHDWSYHWASPEDERKMKSALEDQARLALGLVPPATPPAAPATKKTASGKKAPPAQPPPEPAAEPAPLEDEQFRVFELAYGAGATLVLSARTAGAADQRKYVTLIAQPDLYGNILLLLKHTTDAGHLDALPRMRLVDAVDALADNRGELLFEMRGATQRQFTLYRVLRGRAEELFTGAQGDFVRAAE